MTEKFAVHLPTQWAYDKYMERADKKGWKWNVGDRPTDMNQWYKESIDTCVGYGDKFQYDTVDYYKSKGYKIISYEEATQEETKTSLTSEFVRGEVVEVSDLEKIRDKRIYVTTIDGHIQPYTCVCEGDEERFEQNIGFETKQRNYIRKLPQQEPGPKKITEKDVDDFVKGYSVPQRSIIQAAAIKDFLKEKALMDFNSRE